MWIERIVTETDGDTKLLELHRRLTVIASPDDTLRRAAYERVYQGLKGIRGSHLEVVTENHDRLIALRPAEGEPSLIDARRETEILPENTKGLGLVAQLNDAEAMTSHLRLLHVTHDSLLRRATSDADMIKLAQTPLDQLWTLANSIQSDQEVLNHAETQGDNLSAAAAERDATEIEISGILSRKADHDKRNQQFYMGAGLALGLAGLAAVAVTPLAAIPLLLIAAGLGAAGAIAARNESLLAEHQHVKDNYGSELGLALERVDQLFDNHSISRKQREARTNLDRSVSQWRDLAGGASPEVLIRERPRLEELAGHLRIVNNEAATEVDEVEKLALVGFASLLAELSRRFPAERVPLLIDDLFPSVHPSYHSVLRELVERASHRRQVVLETGDPSAIQWAAAEVVSGDALLITDQEIDFPELSPAADDPQEQAV